MIISEVKKLESELLYHSRDHLIGQCSDILLLVPITVFFLPVPSLHLRVEHRVRLDMSSTLTGPIYCLEGEWKVRRLSGRVFL